MGQRYDIKCVACVYKFTVNKGIGMMYWPENVFYGYCDDPPLLLSLVKSKRIREAVFALLSNGATPDSDYGHELYSCPKCNRLANRFYFKLASPAGGYEPDYHCSECKTELERAALNREDSQIEVQYRDRKELGWKCPECGCKKLEYDLNGEFLMWD